MTDGDEKNARPKFGYSRFDGRPIHTLRDQEADGIRGILHAAGFREFAVTVDGLGYSISTTNADTEVALGDITRFADAMSSAGYSVTPDRDDAQVVMAWPTAEAVARAASPYFDWGGWRLNSEAATLEHEGLEFWVELTDCVDSAQTLDWIAHAVYTQGVDDAVLAGLVRALDDILEFQSALCPQGESKTLTTELIASRIAEVAKTAPRSYLA